MLRIVNEEKSIVKQIADEEVLAAEKSLGEEYKFWKKNGPVLFVSLDTELAGDTMIIDLEIVPLLPRWVKDLLWCKGRYSYLSDSDDLTWSDYGLYIKDIEKDQIFFYDTEQTALLLDPADREEILDALIMMVGNGVSSEIEIMRDSVEIVFLTNG